MNDQSAQDEAHKIPNKQDASSPRAIIITAISNLYLPLGLGLLNSLRQLTFLVPFDIGVIDLGLSDVSREKLSAFGVKIIPARADIEYPDRENWEAQNPGYRALTCRPYLRDYFPGYDVYQWMDADTWAQTPDAINTMLTGALEDDSLHIVSEIDRDYKPYFLSSEPWQMHFNWYKANFPAAEVAAIFPRPMLNAGVWALRATSPVWQAWGQTYSACLQRFTKMTREQFMSDQLSLNMAVYTNGLPLKIMPAEFNWLSLFAVPVIEETTGFFVRPTPPRTPISILHLTHEKKLRTFEVLTTKGNVISRGLMNEKTLNPS